MEDLSIKCSLDKHKNIDAIKICSECRIYMCNKCENLHSQLFEKHRICNINKNGETFTGYCKEKNHYELKYFCKDHNQLCCVACISKLNTLGDGQHKDCNICELENIKDEKKNKLKENIKLLEDLENKFNEEIKELKNIFQKIGQIKEDLIVKIQKIFTKIRNTINERKNQLLVELDNVFKTKYFNEVLINKGEKLPKEIKISLEKGKLIDKEWDNKNVISYINDCINIENNIKTINNIHESINKCKKISINFNPQNDSFNIFLETLKSFGNITYGSFKFSDCPENLNKNYKYILSGENKNILTSCGNGSWMGAICEEELDKSIEEHKWKIKILKTQNKYIMVGVAPSDFDVNSPPHHNKWGWYLYCLDSTLYSGPPFNYSGLNTNLNKVVDEIIIVMNMKKKALKFIINNVDKGDSYNNIPIDKPIYPAVLLCDPNDSVEISEIN